MSGELTAQQKADLAAGRSIQLTQEQIAHGQYLDVPREENTAYNVGAAVGMLVGAILLALVGWRLVRYIVRTVARDVASGIAEGRSRPEQPRD